MNMNKQLKYSSRSSRYTTIQTSSLMILPVENNKMIDTKNIIEIDETCWEDMIDLAEHYYYHKTNKNTSFSNKNFGDRVIMFLCQCWHDEVSPDRYLLRLKK